MANNVYDVHYKVTSVFTTKRPNKLGFFLGGDNIRGLVDDKGISIINFQILIF